MPRSRHWAGVRASGSAEVGVHQPLFFAITVIGSNETWSRLRLVKFAL